MQLRPPATQRRLVKRVAALQESRLAAGRRLGARYSELVLITERNYSRLAEGSMTASGNQSVFEYGSFSNATGIEGLKMEAHAERNDVVRIRLRISKAPGH